MDLCEKRKNQEIIYDRRRDAFVVYHLLNIHLKKGKSIKYETLLYEEDQKNYKKESAKENSIGTPEEMDALLGGEPVRGRNPKAIEMKKKFQDLRKKKFGDKK